MAELCKCGKFDYVEYGDYDYCPRCGTPRPEPAPEMTDRQRAALALINAHRKYLGKLALPSWSDALRESYDVNYWLAVSDAAHELFAAPRDKRIEELTKEVDDLRAVIRANDGKEGSTVVALRGEVSNLAAKLKASEEQRKVKEETDEAHMLAFAQKAIDRDKRIAELEAQLAESAKEFTRAVQQRVDRIEELENETVALHKQLAEAKKAAPSAEPSRMTARNCAETIALIKSIPEPPKPTVRSQEWIDATCLRLVNARRETYANLGCLPFKSWSERFKYQYDDPYWPAMAQEVARILDEETADLRARLDRAEKRAELTKDWVPLLDDYEMEKISLRGYYLITHVEKAMRSKAKQLLMEAGLS